MKGTGCHGLSLFSFSAWQLLLPSTRKLDGNGNWTDWVEGSRQFWHGQIICAKRSETEFEPVMTDDVLTLDKQ